jgi:hypothetical protein
MNYDVENSCHCPVFKTPRQYVEAKLKILDRDFYIKPTRDEILHLYTLKTQIAIDNAVLSIINHHWS